MVDINECNNTPRPCEDVCTNTEGSYQCSCSSSSEYITEDGNCTGTMLSIAMTDMWFIHAYTLWFCRC